MDNLQQGEELGKNIFDYEKGYNLNLQPVEIFPRNNNSNDSFVLSPDFEACQELNEVEELLRVEGIKEKFGEVKMDLHRDILHLLLSKKLTVDTTMYLCRQYGVNFLNEINSQDVCQEIIQFLNKY